MTSTEIRRAILNTLRHDPLNMYEIAGELHQAPFRVRAELKALKRDRLVHDVMAPNSIDWRLTDRGWHHVLAADQMELTS